MKVRGSRRSFQVQMKMVLQVDVTSSRKGSKWRLRVVLQVDVTCRREWLEVKGRIDSNPI